MSDSPNHADAPPGWSEVLAQSEAKLEAGLTVSGDKLMRDLREAIARLEARQSGERNREAVPD